MMEYVLISQQGSGTNLFRAIVNTHPNVYFYDELFCGGERNYETYRSENRYESPKEFLKRKSKEADCDIVGFDLKYNQIGDAGLWDWLIKSDIKIIHLMRDPARTFLRDVREDGKHNFNYVELKEYCDSVRKWQERMRVHFADSPRYREYHYEEMTGGRNLEEELPEFTKESLSKLLEVRKFDFRIGREDFVKKKLSMRF